MPLLFYLPLIIWTGLLEVAHGEIWSLSKSRHDGRLDDNRTRVVPETVLIFHGVLHLCIGLAFSSRYQRILSDVLFVTDDTAHRDSRN
jgi:hypothetical protein